MKRYHPANINVIDFTTQRITICAYCYKMKLTTSGIIAVYLVPGFIGLAGLVPYIPLIGQWITPTGHGVGLGPLLYTLLSGLTVGMIIDCFSRQIIDRIMEWTGVPKAVEPTKVEDYFNEKPCLFYQASTNLLVAIAWAYLVNRILAISAILNVITDVGTIVMCVALLAASRNALLKHRIAGIL